MMRHTVSERKARSGRGRNLMLLSSLHTHVHMTYASIYKYVLTFHIYTQKHIEFVKVRALENREISVLSCFVEILWSPGASVTNTTLLRIVGRDEVWPLNLQNCNTCPIYV